MFLGKVARLRACLYLLLALFASLLVVLLALAELALALVAYLLACSPARSNSRSSQHRFKSAYHKMSHRKLNDIGRLVATMPVDEAILQLQFSEKRAARTWVKSTLAFARDHAVARGLRRERLVVQEAWVSKGTKDKRIDIKGRGRMGMKHHPHARIHFVLKEGKTFEQKREAEKNKVLHQVRSAGMVREDGKLRRKMTSNWAW